ncbi:hypothetical protein BMF94_3527 [Rhodotorula taiwanensis]|uniref:Uncharacterized protein n=1 Tax=Rhodotorula taiwanensis TaxID=741276 RepID=A0A2S5B8U0_9BASI|nr:hypothetical protein BMF94_3527 [Rhodotorula taiwanensis]
MASAVARQTRPRLDSLVLPFLAPRLLVQSTAPPTLAKSRQSTRTASTQAQTKKAAAPEEAWIHGTSWHERWNEREQPVASTSAVRLDAVLVRSRQSGSKARTAPSPALSAAAPAAAIPPLCPSLDDAQSQTVKALVAELEPVLARLRSAYLASPTSTPLELVKSTLAAIQSSSDPRARHSHVPPIPPPLIRLDPEPHAGPKSRLWTPFVLQALFLGASALGLLARRKVAHNTLGEDGHPAANAAGGTGGRATRAAQKARQAAEDRIDEVQALNLLVVALAQPGGILVPERSSRSTGQDPRRKWRDELDAVKGLAALLQQVEAARLPYDRATVLVCLHSVSHNGTDQPDMPIEAVEARRKVGLWAWRARRGLTSADRTVVDKEQQDADGAITRSFLAVLYPTFQAADRHFFPKSPSSTITDRTILNALADEILAPEQSASTSLLRALAETAWRARRVDILGRIATRTAAPVSSPAELSLTLFSTARALEILAMDVRRRREADLVLPWAIAFRDAVVRVVRERQAPVGRTDLGDIRAGLECLLNERSFAINRPLEPVIRDTCLGLLDDHATTAGLAERRLIARVMRRLVASRHPVCAVRILNAIPAHLITLKHYRPLLASSHLPSAMRAWTSLRVHERLRPDAACVRAVLASLAKAPERVSLSFAFRLFRRLVEPTTRDWNLLLRIVARNGSDKLLQRVTREMQDAGRQADSRTAAVFVSREMTRMDTQRRSAPTKHDGPRLVVEQPRRVSGSAQVRKVRRAAREWDSKLGSDTPSPNAPHDILPNLLLKNAVRWPRDYDVPKLVVLTRSRLGVDLDQADSTLSAGPLYSGDREAGTHTGARARSYFEQVRRPAFRTLSKGFEQRGRADLARRLRAALKQEEEATRRMQNMSPACP